MDFFKLPEDFLWGCATASYQVEGAVSEGGRTPSIWDDYCKIPNKVYNGDTGNIACDQYHRYKDDVKIIKDLGFKSYRFSISWSRIIPQEDGIINQEGLNYYINLSKELLKNGIEPAITIYHWDLPSYLQKKGGWENRDTCFAFEKYSKVLFDNLHEYVNKWITINEPYCVTYEGNLFGQHAPGNKDINITLKTIHHINLAHGLAVKQFRTSKYDGEIGITVNAALPRPATLCESDIYGALLGREFATDVFLYPIFRGEYPKELMEEKGYTYPIKKGDLNIISTPIDFLGLNYYSEDAVKYSKDSYSGAEAQPFYHSSTEMGWPIVPGGLLRLLRYLDEVSNHLPIYITENGRACSDVLENNRVHDKERIDYLQQHFNVCKSAIEEGINLKGYYVWSLLDNFEWAEGYEKRFGIVYVDYRTQKRYLKDSAYFMREVMNGWWYR
jgi:beta-glucosidase